MNETRIAAAWHTLLFELGYDPDSAHFADTPRRVARFVSEWHTIGQSPPRLTTFPNDPRVDQMIIVGGLPFYSMCAHHGVPFFGTATVGYLPGESVLGLSKFARVVDHFAHRYTTQETITKLVADYLQAQLKARGVGVMLRAEHLCMSMRGVLKPGHRTTTSEIHGVLRESPEARAEFLALAADKCCSR